MLLFIAGSGESVTVSARSVTIELGVAETEVENGDVPFVGSVVVAAILSVAKLKLGSGSNEKADPPAGKDKGRLCLKSL